MIYPIVIHKDKASDFGVTVPDLPGCFSAGATVEEAMTMAKEAIELHLEGLVEEGHIIPKPRPIDEHRHDSHYRGGVWAFVSIDSAALRVNAKRVNVTIPERVLDAVDRAAASAHDTRSGLLTKAATAYLAQNQPAPGSGRKQKWRQR
ncbi:MAG TPA: type II toxin-antitoxin system HicB family antitoxin [Phycisphaerae bacterium]|jgi:predicted RNase H-like HicB family nuclease